MLIGPLRAMVERGAVDARAILDEMPEYSHGTMGYDAADTALATFEYVGEIARDIRHEVHRAVTGQDGFDTWHQSQLARFVNVMSRLAGALEQLALALRDVREAEEREVSLLLGRSR